MPRVRQISFQAFDVALLEPFGIATGAQELARNVLVRVELDDGTVGLGEAAPFPAVNGETRELVLRELEQARSALVGRVAERYRVFSAAAREALAGAPSALCAVETALFDALCRRAGLSLWSFFGGTDETLARDITIPTGDAHHAREAALRAQCSGFRTLKVKIGGVALDDDRRRIVAVLEAAPEASLILDANASLEADEAIALLESLGPLRSRVALFEQPTPAEDLDGLRAVRDRGRVLVAADESARSAADVARLGRAGAADVINIKIMKTGLVEAWDMILGARTLGLGLMVGGMVETELAMTTSACLAAGIGGFQFVDLDTPLFMKVRPFRGGFEEHGPLIRVDGNFLGHGVDFCGHEQFSGAP